MVLENWVRGKIHELLGHYIEIDRESLKIGAPLTSAFVPPLGNFFKTKFKRD
jgi:hypothetical protein